MEKFTLINKDRDRIKVFELFENITKDSPSIDAMMISQIAFLREIENKL